MKREYRMLMRSELVDEIKKMKQTLDSQVYWPEATYQDGYEDAIRHVVLLIEHGVLVGTTQPG